MEASSLANQGTKESPSRAEGGKSQSALATVDSRKCPEEGRGAGCERHGLCPWGTPWAKQGQGKAQGFNRAEKAGLVLTERDWMLEQSHRDLEKEGDSRRNGVSQGTFLVAQWLRRFPLQGAWVLSLVGEDPARCTK